ncbi:MAG: hypothetical protein HY290_25545 [Planctomycetia bacterium]|nr:hypothetical protein [Planctomycetia bacterium]
MKDTDLERMNRAIQECLERCRGASDAIAQVAAFVAALKTAGWNKFEIRVVEMGVLQILSGLAETQKYSVEDTDRQRKSRTSGGPASIDMAD